MRLRMFVFIGMVIFGIGWSLGRLLQPNRATEIEREAARLAAKIRREREKETAVPQQTEPQVEKPVESAATDSPETLAAEGPESSPSPTAAPSSTQPAERLGFNSHNIPHMTARPLGFDGQPLMPTPTFTPRHVDSPDPTNTPTLGPTYTPAAAVQPQIDHGAQPVPVVDPSSFNGNGLTQSGYRFGD